MSDDHRPTAACTLHLRLALVLAAAFLAAHAAASLAQPAPPSNLSAVVAGSTVTLSWQAPAGGAPNGGYVVEAGSRAGAADLATMPVGAPPVSVGGVPTGQYYVRVRGRSATALGVPSNEILIAVGSAPLPNLPTRNGIPMSGQDVPGLAAFDEAVTSFMARKGISAGSMAMMSGNRLVLERGYGWTSSERRAFVRPDALFRLASVTKPVTMAMVHRLASEGRIRLSDRAVCTGSNAPCHLTLPPVGSRDPRLGSITIQHLMDHSGGWDRDMVGDLTYMDGTAARALGVASPPSRDEMLRWITSQPLQFTPGAREAYANVGYLFLGAIIERVTGMSWFDYARAVILGPLGVPAADVVHGRSLPHARDPREPAYEDPRTGPSVFPPYEHVRLPDGSFHLEARTGVGNLVASASAIGRFLSAYWISGLRREPGSNYTYWFTGAYAGTLTLAAQFSNGRSIVVLLNRRYTNAGQEIDIDELYRTLTALAHGTSW